jgi:flagellar biogenesis protein FliO
LARAHNESKAAETNETHATKDAPESPTNHSPWAAVGALAVVICLILILARIFRRHAPLFAQTLPSEAVEVLGRRFIDQRQSVVLLRVGSRILVVGSSTAGLQGLGELTDAVEVDLIAGMCRGARNGNNLGSSFFGLLRGQAVPQRPASPPPILHRTEPRRTDPHRSEPQGAEPARRREPQAPAPAGGVGQSGPRTSDPEHELMRRLRGGPSAGSADSEVAEVFRE